MEIREKRTEFVVVGYSCDICKKRCDEGNKYNHEYSTFRAIWGYGSKKDGDEWNGVFCEDCSDRILEFIESLEGTISITTK